MGRHFPKHCGGKKDSAKRSDSFQNPKGSCPQDLQVHLLLGTMSTLESLLRALSLHSGAGFSREPHAWPPEQRRELFSGRRASRVPGEGPPAQAQSSEAHEMVSGDTLMDTSYPALTYLVLPWWFSISVSLRVFLLRIDLGTSLVVQW